MENEGKNQTKTQVWEDSYRCRPKICKAAELMYNKSDFCIHQLVLFLHLKYIRFIIKKDGLPEFLKDLATSPVKHFVSAGRLQTEQ